MTNKIWVKVRIKSEECKARVLVELPMAVNHLIPLRVLCLYRLSLTNITHTHIQAGKFDKRSAQVEIFAEKRAPKYSVCSYRIQL